MPTKSKQHRFRIRNIFVVIDNEDSKRLRWNIRMHDAPRFVWVALPTGASIQYLG